MQTVHVAMRSVRSRIHEDAEEGQMEEDTKPLLSEEDEDYPEVSFRRMKTSDWKCRYGILLFDCLIVFGTYFCIDMPSALQNELQADKQYHCDVNTTFADADLPCCKACLGLGPHKYNLLHAFLFWTSSVLSLFSGFVIDRLGNRVSAVSIIILTSIGTWLFAFAGSDYLRDTDAMFPVMVIGRTLIGFGDGPIRIVQDRIIAFWFHDDSVMAVGLVVLSRRAGTMLNFLITANMAKFFGLSWALIFGAILCSMGLPCALAMAGLDYYGTKQLDKQTQKQMVDKPIKISEIKNLTRTFWLHIAMIGAHYCAFFAFVANGSKYIQDRFGYSMVDASYVNGAAYFAAVFLSPFLAIILKKIDCNGLVSTIVTFFSIPLFPLFAYVPSVPPLVITLWLGVVYNFNVIIMWQVAINLLPPQAFGTASGIGLFVMRMGIGLTNLTAGNILGQEEDPDPERRLQKYQTVLIMLMCFSISSVIFGVILNCIDITHGAKINRRLAKKNEEKSTLLNEELPKYNDRGKRVETTYEANISESEH